MSNQFEPPLFLVYKWSGGCDSVIDPVDPADMTGTNYTLVTSSAEASPSVCFEAWHFAVIAFGVALAVYIVIRLLMIPNLKSKLEKMSIGKSNCIFEFQNEKKFD